MSTRDAIDALDAWLREQRIDGLLPREQAESLLAAWRDDEAFWARFRPRFEQAWAKAEQTWIDEERPLEQLLSPEAKARVLDAAAAFEPDAEALSAFMRSPAVEETLGDVLYNGITEFLKRVDLLGGFIDKLPVLGGIQRRVRAAFKDEVEGRLEGQIKSFLGGFSGRATDRMIQRVLSPENREGFQDAQRRLAEHMLQRPLKSLIPDAAARERARETVWEGLRKAALQNEGELLERLYEAQEQTTVGDWLWSSDEVRQLGADLLERFFSSEQGAAFRPEACPPQQA